MTRKRVTPTGPPLLKSRGNEVDVMLLLNPVV